MKTVIFKSEKSPIFFLLLFAVPIIFIFKSVIEQTILGLAISLALLIFVSFIWFRMEYIITENDLITKTAFGNSKTPLISITAVKKTTGFLAAAALSTNRVEVFYNKYDSLIISPKNQNEFIKILFERCPNIN